ncbi:bifunctional tRNA (5-methylaminomethyl-2-thiouridine)(34)-methyltransferase MnmD/FAD-dependent 5-carboxymethylaminomethyl-2-thiouridine(34) oxidoreductase MnmC [Leptospira mayottensis]|uniref:bifunctional tRNA (5-methylaminomethyl-2-thiouridine)(34)-methyltransferase MnmD/FAD-dependent 5-carboxymethylaminomethyl-2-thiouridine(34) oxidoreductase MnmC n=1 Tax=Leptospira mayottensis TaxID=1137606 RepID=UPI000E35AE53|nr:bifunctional tRNA (5-methylaminomethyl-2-thiouridine)(34)-methyltransferase MnmD/FAD-dependent 5-carboxymethylaminomethyl-2-thiouridine(34) oxidoreductase MnmC [Leptospira mayottensis]AXR67253.1 bifunctional tRNA (5-methylaminomethyl-2-thiouridine)(34)-methyltransferase MnmD/FAD-dependent 5-carboxymethylaminomethyl-2-thiouridine(34) oxidoreductase MnmC [Leptospira mayottensis]
MLSWKNNLTPVSDRFDDIYFSPENGLEEAKHVFIGGNDLPNRWRNSNIQNSFCILELGFGTGLNFFTTWKEYLEHKNRFRLHFISVEKFPLRREEISKAISVFSELEEIKEEFLSSYQDLIPGMNYFQFLEGKIHLTLFLGDVADALYEISGKVDAIFLDGFAPSKNPEMWKEPTLRNLKNVSKSGTTFSTFTVARTVRDSLSAVGFTLEKRPGFGRKREMLTGKYSNHPSETKESIPKEKPWCKRSDPESQIKTAAIIGAGIAGSALAYSLSKRGIQVFLIDPSGIANETSGIPRAISHPHLTKIPGPISLFTLRAFRYALSFLSSFADKDQFGKVGLFHGVTEEMSSERFRKSIENHKLTEEIASWKPNDFDFHKDNLFNKELGVFFQSGFWTQPGSISRKCADQSGIELIRDTANSFERTGTSWKLGLKKSDQEIFANSIIFCNSYLIGKLVSSLFEGEDIFPINKVRGQLISLKETESSSRIPNILCAEHYLTPSVQGEHILGSTFDEFDLNLEPRKEDTDLLLQYVQTKYPTLGFDSNCVLSEKTGFRAQTPDRFPIIGPIFDPKVFRETYKEIDLPRNRNKKFPNLKTIPGLYVFGGLGSRGVLSSFLGAEILASLILGEPAPVEFSILESLHPARFLYRRVRK